MKPLFKRSVKHTMKAYGVTAREAIQLEYANPSHPFLFNNGTVVAHNGHNWSIISKN